MRFVGGFLTGYGIGKLAPSVMPSLTPDADSPLNFIGGITDAALMGAGGYVAATDTSDAGDFATGVFAAGTIQTADRIVEAITGWINKAKAGNGG